MRSPAVVTVAVLSLFALTGCVGTTTQADTPTPTQTPSPSPTPVASGPLTCHDLVPVDLVSTALEGADGAPVEPVAAVKHSDVFDGVLLEGAGGLPCSWRVGSGMPEYNAPSDWAYLRVDVLPGAAARWVPLQLGEAPSTDTREIAGVEASVAGGDPGWAISAPVGDSWVVTSISAAALTSTGGRFLGLDAAVIIDRLADVAESAFTTLQQATPAQLDLPSAELRLGDAACDGALDQQGIVDAMQLPADSTVEYSAGDPTTVVPDGFEAAVRTAARAFSCVLHVDGMAFTTITAAHGFSPYFDEFATPDGDVGFEPFELVDAPQNAEAVVTRNHDGPSSPAYLSIGDTLYEISGDGAEAVAQAILAQSR